LDPNYKIYSGHKGFVRLALQEGALLLPMLSMGEWTLQDNVYLPTMQAFFRKYTGIPIPFCPYGRYERVVYELMMYDVKRACPLACFSVRVH
jgi:hypothetical protein